jgi:hypothetical protein
VRSTNNNVAAKRLLSTAASHTSSVVKTAPAVLCKVGEIIAGDVTLIKRMLVGASAGKARGYGVGWQRR